MLCNRARFGNILVGSQAQYLLTQALIKQDRFCPARQVVFGRRFRYNPTRQGTASARDNHVKLDVYFCCAWSWQFCLVSNHAQPSQVGKPSVC